MDRGEWDGKCVVLLPSEGSSIRITNPNGGAALPFVIPSEAEGSAVRPGRLPKLQVLPQGLNSP
jgi:hypothetical protein